MNKLLLSIVLLLSVYSLQAQTSTLFATGFNQAYGLVFDASGNLYVANANGNSVSKVDASGAVTGTYTGFNTPVGLTFDASGNLYVANATANTVSKINASGTVTAIYAGFGYPVGLTFDASGYLYVANEFTSTVNKVDAGGNIVATYTGFVQPIGLTFDATGNLFVANISGNTVNKVDASGNITATYYGFNSPTDLCFDASGNLYITNSDGNNVSIIPAGSVDGTTATNYISGLPYAPFMLTYHDHALYVSDADAQVYKITGGILQTHHYVKPDATGANNGNSWADAYTDFQTAIDAAQNGDSIFVAQATYQPASGTSFIMKEGVKIFGGFLGTETDFSQRNLADKATLQGNGASVIYNNNNGLTAAAVLDGFIVTGGNASYGGGMYNSSSSSPTVTHCSFWGNNVAGNGGGIYNSGAHPIITNCTFSGNSAFLYGGGMFNDNASPTITNCAFSGNTVNFGDGGGIYNYYAGPVITNTIIWGNSGSTGMYNNSSSTTITYSDVQNFIAGTGNISADPLFTDAANGNFTLQSGSPCINAGTPDTTDLHIGNIDLAGNARVTGSAIDMGAYEFSATLPVTLTSFTGTLQNNTATLQWKSGEESNFNRYTIEKSTNRSSFATVANVGAKGSNSSYTYALMQPEPTAYYRLGMVDNDGKSRYSGIITLSQNGNGRISVYPNPAKDYIHVNVANAGNIRIYNVSGVLVKTVQLQTGLNKINVDNLSAGTYFIVSGNKTIKFIKQ